MKRIMNTRRTHQLVTASALALLASCGGGTANPGHDGGAGTTGAAGAGRGGTGGAGVGGAGVGGGRPAVAALAVAAPAVAWAAAVAVRAAVAPAVRAAVAVPVGRARWHRRRGGRRWCGPRRCRRICWRRKWRHRRCWRKRGPRRLGRRRYGWRRGERRRWRIAGRGGASGGGTGGSVGGSGVGGAIAGATEFCTTDGWCWANPLPHGLDVAGLSVLAPDDAWAVGQGGIVMHFDGAVWKRIDAGITKYVQCVRAFAHGDVWVSGEDGIKHYDGSSWQKVDPGFTGWIQTLAGTGPEDLWVSNVSRHHRPPHRDGLDDDPLEQQLRLSLGHALVLADRRVGGGPVGLPAPLGRHRVDPGAGRVRDLLGLGRRARRRLVRRHERVHVPLGRPRGDDGMSCSRRGGSSATSGGPARATSGRPAPSRPPSAPACSGCSAGTAASGTKRIRGGRTGVARQRRERHLDGGAARDAAALERLELDAAPHAHHRHHDGDLGGQRHGGVRGRLGRARAALERQRLDGGADAVHVPARRERHRRRRRLGGGNGHHPLRRPELVDPGRQLHEQRVDRGLAREPDRSLDRRQLQFPPALRQRHGRVRRPPVLLAGEQHVGRAAPATCGRWASWPSTGTARSGRPSTRATARTAS